MEKLDDAVKELTIVTMCLMRATEGIDELKHHPVYGQVFKASIKVAAKQLTNQYDAMMNKLTRNAGIEIHDEIVESYKVFSEVIDESFTFNEQE